MKTWHSSFYALESRGDADGVDDDVLTLFEVGPRTVGIRETVPTLSGVCSPAQVFGGERANERWRDPDKFKHQTINLATSDDAVSGAGAEGADLFQAWNKWKPGDDLPQGWVSPDYWDSHWGSGIAFDEVKDAQGTVVARREVPTLRQGGFSLAERGRRTYTLGVGAPADTPEAPAPTPAAPAPAPAAPRDLPPTTPTIEEIVEPILDALTDAYQGDLGDPEDPTDDRAPVVPAITSTQVYGTTIAAAAESVPFLADRAFEPRTAPSLTGRRRAGRKTLLG